MGPIWRSTSAPLDHYVPALASGVKAKPCGLATLGLDPTGRPEMLASKGVQ